MWNDGLTEEQARAASHFGSHACLLAGPGTGKTLTLTRRILYLIQEKGVPPSEILVLTFTRAAAGELRQRIRGELGETANNLVISTLHSYALSTLLRHGAAGRLPTPIRIADDFEERHIVEEDLKSLAGLSNVREARELLQQLSADWEQLAADAPGYRFLNPHFYGAWQQHRSVFGYTLRAELVYQLKHVLEERALTVYQPPKHILVDEYQDLNACDLAVIRKLAELGAEIYATGDDDQSIYGFRYAQPVGIRRFLEDYVPATSFTLSECQRCGSNILSLAEYVAAQDVQRLRKNITPARGVPPGEVHVLNFPNQRIESLSVARICHWLVSSQGIRPANILILVRTDRDGVFSNPLCEALDELALPVSRAVDPLEPLESQDGRRFLNILRLAANESDHLAWRTLLQFERNGIGKKTLETLYNKACSEGRGFGQIVLAVSSDPNLLEKHGRTIAAQANTIRQVAQAARETIQNNKLADAIDMLANSLVSGPNLRQDILALCARVMEAAAPRNLDDLLRAFNTSLGDVEQEKHPNVINIMTMHQAKGLTADAVIIVGAEEEYIPGRAQGSAVDDERRLLYVSLTRARRYLYITHCNNRTGQQRHTGRNPSSTRRMLTHFLSGGPVVSEDGQRYVQGLR